MIDNIISFFFDRASSQSYKNNVNSIDSIIPMEGIFELKLVEKDGTVSKHIHEKNLIVDASFEILSSLLLYGDASKTIASIALGEQGIVNNQYIPPLKSDRTLRMESFRKVGFQNILVESVREKSITFQWIMDYTEGNGSGAKIYNEAGLFASDGTMFSRKVFSEIVKTPEQIVFVNWQLRFVEK